jgi:c-di-AMP phosphodiesterase-like protein
MKNKANLFKPAITIALATQLIACVILWSFDIRAFYVAAAALLISVAGVVLVRHLAERDIERFVQSLCDAVGAAQSGALINFPLPVFAVNQNSEVVWFNDLCGKKLFADKIVCGKPADEIFGQKLSPETEYISYEGRNYASFWVRSPHDEQMILVCYLVDQTELMHEAAEFHRSRPSVWMIRIDSLDEILQNAKENERSNLLSQIEFLVEKFIGDRQGLIIKTHQDRFVAVVEERYMGEIVEKRFELLDSVRGLAPEEKTPVTLSIGIARNVLDYVQGEQGARQALDMAQGRGGDQAAVRRSAGYDFYGGLSKGVEKRTKVKTRIVATAMVELIETASNILIMGHKFADLDCLGAAAGLAGAIGRMGKHCEIVIDRAHNLVGELIDTLESNGFENSFIDPVEALIKIKPDTLLFIVDTHIEGVLESAELYRAAKNIVVIDHHRRMVGYIENAVIFYHEPFASSTSEMVAELVQYFGRQNPIGRPEAEALLAGIMLDTKNFVLRTGVRTFEAAAYLRRQGADTANVREMFSTTMSTYRLRTGIVSSAQIIHNCAIAAAGEADNIKLIAPQAADELLCISGVDASFVLYEYEGGVSISARSMGKINVQVIMEAMGGGGHQTMAATQISGMALDEAQNVLIGEIEEFNANNK